MRRASPWVLSSEVGYRCRLPPENISAYDARLTIFHIEHTSPLSRSEIRTWALEPLGRDLVEYARYSLTSQSRCEVEFTRTYRTPLVWIATVLTFPLGILFYLAGKRQDIITVLMGKAPEGAAITLAGSAKPRVIEGVRHRLFEDLNLAEPCQRH